MLPACRRAIQPRCPQRLLPIRRALSSAAEERYNWNPEVNFDETPDEKFARYPLVTARDLAAFSKPQREVRMLARDFIEDALYNPHYGYFSKRAVIFTPADDAGFDFVSMRNALAFDKAVAQRYEEYGKDEIEGPGNQIWHTPTELFKPWYGQAIADCLVSEYLLKYFPYGDFVIYELGAGNGTLAKNILDYLRVRYPEVYECTRYSIVEISESLSQRQRETLRDHPRAQIIQRSIFDWQGVDWAPCFVVALEVADNFAHDIIRYSTETMEPYMTLVAVDETGDFHELFQRVYDPLIKQYLTLHRKTSHKLPYVSSWLWRNITRKLPFSANLSPRHFVPTRLLDLLNKLRTCFPRHRLLLSDFSSLPESIPGHLAPVVQTRFRGEMVPVTTYMVAQGWFDIFFPTDFELMRDIYELVMSLPPRSNGPATPFSNTATSLELGSQYFFFRGRRSPVDGVISASGLPIGQRRSNVYTHREFLEEYADLDKTRLRNGENPMIEQYKNVKVLW